MTPKMEVKRAKREEEKEDWQNKVDALGKGLSELTEMLTTAEPADATARILLDKIHEVVGQLSQCASATVNVVDNALRDIVEPTHTIGRVTRARIGVNEDCIRDFWETMESKDGYTKATIQRRDGSVSTFRKQSDVWKERNCGREEIIELKLSVEDTHRTCQVVWSAYGGNRWRTELHVFDVGEEAQKTFRDLERVLAKYQKESDIWRRGRETVRLLSMFVIAGATLIYVFPLTPYATSHFNARLWISMAAAGTITWLIARLASKVDKSVEIELGYGKARNKQNRWMRKIIVMTAVTIVLSELVKALWQ